MQKLITELFGRWDGKPALVIGGGPSVLKDLPRLDIVPDLVISANEHGCKQNRFKVDLITNVDKQHCEFKIPMEQYLRPYGVPIVNRHSWADYRLPDWTFSGNTGMQAIALAALLGANPVIVTGIDMWHGGRVYFHREGAKAPKGHRKLRAGKMRDRMKVQPLVQFVAGANIRPMSGALVEFFKQYQPGASAKPARPIGCRLRLEEETQTVMCRVTKPFRLATQDMTRVGQVLALSHFEYQRHIAEVEVLTASPDLI